MASLDQISRAIGSLESGHKHISESIGGVQTQLREIASRLHALPPSPTCLDEHKKMRVEITELRIANAKQAGAISAIVALAAIVGKALLAKIGFAF